MKKILFINALILIILLGISALLMYGIGVSKLENFYKTDYYQSDSVAVFTHQPNYVMTFEWIEHPRGEITFKTNNLGFRNNEDIEIPKAENEVRVLITGDSHTDGVVFNEESLAAVLQEKLDHQTGESNSELQYVVMNGGHGFYSFKNYYGLLKKYQNLQLDHFVIIVFTGNDFRETLLYEEESKLFGNVMKNMLFRMKRKVKLEWGHDIPLNQGIDQGYYFRNHPKDLEKALKIAKHYTKSIRGFCQQNNIELTIAMLPPKTGIDENFFEEVSSELGLKRELKEVNEKLINNFTNWGKSQGINMLDLQIPLSKTDGTMYWKQDLHINHHAHKAIGEYLFTELFSSEK